MRKEKEALALKEKFHLSQASIAKALASDFVCSFFINKHTGHYIEFSSSEAYKALGFPAVGDDFFSVFENGLLRIIYPEDRDITFKAFNRENILSVLEVDKAFSILYRIMLSDVPTYVDLKIVPMIDDEDHLVAGIKNIDAHMKRIQEYENYKRNSLTFAGIAEALASDYAALLYVNIKNDKYMEYYSSERYKSLGIPKEGLNIFTGDAGLKQHVFKEDLPLYLTACNKENVMKVLEVDKSFSLTVRMMVKDIPYYCQIKITKMMLEDDYHVVIGISNIDERMKREENYNRSINEVKEIAYRDALTGVKSKHAYGDMELRVNEEIKNNTISPFALVVCDVNNLKKINDTLGHKAGDEYIKEACSLVCKTFTHSPVYRIGGDEFVVFLEGSDYEERIALLNEINDIIDINNEQGKVTISLGMADYALCDTSLYDVFEKADYRMYTRKKELKDRLL